MSLEFAKVVEQVQTMGRFLGHKERDAQSKIDIAFDLYNAACDLDWVHDRIQKVRESSVSGYRGAAPAPRPFSENLCDLFDLPALPEAATLIAADGSQVYPDQHGAVLYYLINIGIFAYYYGMPRVPYQFTSPELFYTDKHIYDRDGRVITNQTVNARRSLMEMQWLAKASWMMRDEARPIIAVHDGGLLKFFGANEVADAQTVENEYMDALQMLNDTGALLIGFAENTRSTNVVSLLHLLSLPPATVNDAALKTNGEMEGLRDKILFSLILREPGQRSALMTQNSPQNREYKQRGVEYEIAFFYMNVANGSYPVIVRVELPMWVAMHPQAVAAVQSTLYAQCNIQGRKRYPYALTRADELAVIKGVEKGQLDEMIRIEMLRNAVNPEESNKLQTKGLARGDKRHHRLGG